MIAIIDVCGNNLTSLSNAVKRLGFEAVLTHNPTAIQAASHVILPGVGAARPAMKSLQETRLIPVLKALTRPLLGICLGMQLFFESSEEDNVEGLGLIKGQVKKLPASEDYPVPHMGWNNLQWHRASPLGKGVLDNPYVYFVHSYAVLKSDSILAVCNYQTDFAAMVQKENIVGMQFHPEKSAQTGAILLRNFLETV